jgi:hypothetical protein
VSEMLWCDRGNHPFSANDPGRTVFTEQVNFVDAQAGKHATRVDTCGPCNKGQGLTDIVRELMAPKKNGETARTPAEVAKARGYDPKYVEWLEKETHQPVDAEFTE